MPKLFNDKGRKTRRKGLRNAMTKAETILWTALKNDALGFRFRRQYGIGTYFADFYCPVLRLVVEVDGDSHFLSARNEEYDLARTAFFNQHGISVIRCTNVDVYENLSGVMAAILDAIDERKNSLPPRSARSTPS